MSDRWRRLRAGIDQLLRDRGRPLELFGETVDRAQFSAPDGLLPVVLAEAQEVWGRAGFAGSLPFTLIWVEDTGSYFGIRAEPTSGTPVIVALSCIDLVIDRCDTGDRILLNGLVKRWLPRLREAEFRPSSMQRMTNGPRFASDS